jgi:hypothetical protein
MAYILTIPYLDSFLDTKVNCHPKGNNQICLSELVRRLPPKYDDSLSRGSSIFYQHLESVILLCIAALSFSIYKMIPTDL